MIKFKIDIMKELKNKGWSANRLRCDPVYRLSESTMQSIRTACKNDTNISINTKAINTICELLKKQPGQILEYVPDDQTTTK